jgi:hypothetical protein
VPRLPPREDLLDHQRPDRREEHVEDVGALAALARPKSCEAIWGNGGRGRSGTRRQRPSATASGGAACANDRSPRRTDPEAAPHPRPHNGPARHRAASSNPCRPPGETCLALTIRCTPRRSGVRTRAKRSLGRNPRRLLESAACADHCHYAAGGWQPADRAARAFIDAGPSSCAGWAPSRPRTRRSRWPWACACLPPWSPTSRRPWRARNDRAHVAMRGTLHYVPAADAAGCSACSRPASSRAARGGYRELELDAAASGGRRRC